MSRNNMNTKKILILISVFFLSCLFSNFVSAQENSTTTDTNLVATSTSDVEKIINEINSSNEIVSTDLQNLDGVNIKEPKNIPSKFGIMWQDFRHSLSLTFTFDKAKKAEKRLQYAEEKIKIANFIAGQSDNPKVQEKAQKMIEVASKHITKIEENKDKYLDNIDERKARLLKNLAIHKLNTEKVLEKMEDKIPAEKLEQFQNFRDKLAEKKDIFLEKIQSNSNIPDDVKQKITETQNAIEEKRVEREQIRLEMKDLIDNAKAGDQEVKNELEQKRTEIIQTKEQKIQELQNKKAEIIEDIKSGDENLKRQAILEMKKINLEQKIQNVEKVINKNEIKAQIIESRNNLKKEVKQMIQKSTANIEVVGGAESQ